ELAIVHFASFRLGLILCAVDALDAERAFFHDAASSDGHIRVQLIGKRFGTFVVTPVEGTYLVRAVIRAVTRTDAAVIHLQVDLLCHRMYGRERRTDRLAGCASALLAHHRLVVGHAHFGIFTLPETLDADPVHGA